MKTLTHAPIKPKANTPPAIYPTWTVRGPRAGRWLAAQRVPPPLEPERLAGDELAAALQEPDPVHRCLERAHLATPRGQYISSAVLLTRVSRPDGIPRLQQTATLEGRHRCSPARRPQALSTSAPTCRTRAGRFTLAHHGPHPGCNARCESRTPHRWMRIKKTAPALAAGQRAGHDHVPGWPARVRVPCNPNPMARHVLSSRLDFGGIAGVSLG